MKFQPTKEKLKMIFEQVAMQHGRAKGGSGEDEDEDEDEGEGEGQGGGEGVS